MRLRPDDRADLRHGYMIAGVGVGVGVGLGVGLGADDRWYGDKEMKIESRVIEGWMMTVRMEICRGRGRDIDKVHGRRWLESVEKTIN